MSRPRAKAEPGSDDRRAAAASSELEIVELVSRRWLWAVAFALATVAVVAFGLLGRDLRGLAFGLVALGGAAVAAMRMPNQPRRAKLRLRGASARAFFDAAGLARGGVRAVAITRVAGRDGPVMRARVLASRTRLGAPVVRAFEIPSGPAGEALARRVAAAVGPRDQDPRGRFVLEHKLASSLTGPIFAWLLFGPFALAALDAARMPIGARVATELVVVAWVAMVAHFLARRRVTVVDERGISLDAAFDERFIEHAEVARVDANVERLDWFAKLRLRGGEVVRVPFGDASPDERVAFLRAVMRGAAAASAPAHDVPVAALRAPGEPVARWFQRLRAHVAEAAGDHRRAPVPRPELEAIARDAKSPPPVRVVVAAALAADPEARTGLRVAEFSRDDPAAQRALALALALASSDEALDDPEALARLEAAVEELEARDARPAPAHRRRGAA